MAEDDLRTSSEVLVLHPDNMVFKGGVSGIGSLMEIFHRWSLRKLVYRVLPKFCGFSDSDKINGA